MVRVGRAAGFWGVLVGCGLALPLLLDVPASYSSGSVLRHVALAALLAATLLLAGLQMAGPRPTNRLALCILAAAAIPAFALAATLREDGWQALREASPWVALAVLPWLLARALADRRAWAAADFVVRLAALAATAWVLLDGLGRWPLPAVGPFGRPGVAGPMVAALLLPQMASQRAAGRRAALLVVVLLGLAALYLTRSRTAAVALLAGGCVFVALAAPPTRPRVRRLAWASLVVLALGIALAAFHVLPLPGGRTTLDVRLGLWRASTALAGEVPLGGHGLGRYGEEVLRVRDPQEAQLEQGRRPSHAHMDVLHVAAEAGWLGALALLVFWGGAFLVVRSASRAAQTGTRSDRFDVAGWGAALAVLAAASLGEGVLIDPAGVVVAIAALTCLLARLPRRDVLPDVPSERRIRQAAWLAVPLALGFVWAHERLRRADRAYVLYLAEAGAALVRGDAHRADGALRSRLLHGTLEWNARDARAWFQAGVQHARMNRRFEAGEAFRTAVRHDRGMTEARLDLATLHESAGRHEDAETVLAEARLDDPTRFDVALRRGHLALGPEPVPGDEAMPFNLERVLQRYNEARRISPAATANEVALARVERRLGRLDLAAAALRKALERAGGRLETAPAELLLESFRLAELERGTTELVQSGILVLALTKRPTLAIAIAAEGERFLELATEREAAAKTDLGLGDLESGALAMKLGPADRAYKAATLRLAAVLLAGFGDPAAEHQAARADADARQFRRSLARYRALLAWTHLDAAASADLPLRLEAIARRGDVLLEAAAVARRVDGALARTYAARGHALIGAEMLARNETGQAIRLLKLVLEEDGSLAEVRLALAEAHAREGDHDDAERHLLAALAADPQLLAVARSRPAFEPLRTRRRIAAVWGP